MIFDRKFFEREIFSSRETIFTDFIFFMNRIILWSSNKLENDTFSSFLILSTFQYSVFIIISPKIVNFSFEKFAVPLNKAVTSYRTSIFRKFQKIQNFENFTIDTFFPKFPKIPIFTPNFFSDHQPTKTSGQSRSIYWRSLCWFRRDPKRNAKRYWPIGRPAGRSRKTKSNNIKSPDSSSTTRR